MLIRSSDGGKTWKEYSTIAASDPKRWPWMGIEGPNETALVRLADNRLYAVFRTGGSSSLEGLGQAWSSDDGKTWTPPTSMAHQGVAPRLRRLSNGVLALTTGRPGPVVVMFSIDGTGEKWSQITQIFAQEEHPLHGFYRGGAREAVGRVRQHSLWLACDSVLGQGGKEYHLRNVCLCSEEVRAELEVGNKLAIAGLQRLLLKSSHCRGNA